MESCVEVMYVQRSHTGLFIFHKSICLYPATSYLCVFKALVVSSTFVSREVDLASKRFVHGPM